MNFINTCFETTSTYHTIAYYSHLVPVAIAMLLAIVVLFKSNHSLLSKTFFVFVLSFCAWLVGDVFLWVISDHDWINAIWSTLDYINILFYLFGAYFFSVFIRGKDITLWHKVLFFALSLPAWIMTFNGNSTTGFYEPWCEALNSDWLTTYKLWIEALVVAYILISTIVILFRGEKGKKKQAAIVSLGLLLFFGTFSITEYISSVTGVYEINLYSLFVLPFFLLLIIYSIVNLKIFDLKTFGTRLLVYVLLIMIGSQFFFLEASVAKLLTVFTFTLSAVFGVLLLRTISREIIIREQLEKAKIELEKANVRLKALDKQKTEFVSLASHQLRAPMTAIKGYITLMLEGDFGEVPKKLEEPIQRIFGSTQSLIQIVGDFLDVTRIELGTMKYTSTNFDFKDLMQRIIGELKPNIEQSKLEFKFESGEGVFPLCGDEAKLKQVFNNLIDNSLKYTKHGWVHVSLQNLGSKYRLEIKDTGVGINKETLPKLFEKFVRAENANEANVVGTGLGLFVAKQMIEKHNGKIWAESEGEGKGSTFIVEIAAK